MSNKAIDTKQARDEFQHYLVDMSDTLQGFMKEAEGSGYHLGQSTESLDELEKYLLAIETRVNDRDHLISQAATYFGEVVRKHYGGRWKLSLENPKAAFYGFPIIVGHSRYSVELCPIRSIRTFLNSKKPGLLRQIIENHMNPNEIKLTPET
jgi:hypothetical protein